MGKGLKAGRGGGKGCYALGLWLAAGVDKGAAARKWKGGNPEIRGTGVKCSSPVFLPNTLL